MDAYTGTPLQGEHREESVDPRERRRQLVYFAWSLGIILLINALYLSSLFFGRDSSTREVPEHLSEPAPGVLAP